MPAFLIRLKCPFCIGDEEKLRYCQKGFVGGNFLIDWNMLQNLEAFWVLDCLYDLGILLSSNTCFSMIRKLYGFYLISLLETKIKYR